MHPGRELRRDAGWRTCAPLTERQQQEQRTEPELDPCGRSRRIAVESPRSETEAITTNTAVARTIPTSHPARKATLVEPARGDNIIKITAMIGTGQIAIPIASGSTAPMTSAMQYSHREGSQRMLRRQGVRGHPDQVTVARRR